MTFTGIRAKLRICDYIRVFFHPLEACLIWWYKEIRMNVNGITNVNVVPIFISAKFKVSLQDAGVTAFDTRKLFIQLSIVFKSSVSLSIHRIPITKTCCFHHRQCRQHKIQHAKLSTTQHGSCKVRIQKWISYSHEDYNVPGRDTVQPGRWVLVLEEPAISVFTTNSEILL